VRAASAFLSFANASPNRAEPRAAVVDNVLDSGCSRRIKEGKGKFPVILVGRGRSPHGQCGGEVVGQGGVERARETHEWLSTPATTAIATEPTELTADTGQFVLPLKPPSSVIAARVRFPFTS
jgi:hypothetical protein